MAQRILIRAADGSWREPTAAAYVAEAELQGILAEHPELVPGTEPGSVACTEMPLETGPADVVVVGPDASVTIVECKLARNAEARRVIIGQIIDYASALRGMSVATFDGKWHKRAGSSVVDAFAATVPGFAEALQESLAAGAFRLVLAVDAINSPLQRMVEYLSGTHGVSVVAVEYARLRLDGVEMLLPTVYGQELAEARVLAEVESAEAREPGVREVRERRRWTVDAIREDLSSRDPGSLPAFDAIAAAVLEQGLDFDMRTTLEPRAAVEAKDAVVGKVGEVVTGSYSNGRMQLELEFGMAAAEPRAPALGRVEALLSRIAGIDGRLAGMVAEINERGLGNTHPNRPLAQQSPESMAALVALVAEFNAAGGNLRV